MRRNSPPSELQTAVGARPVSWEPVRGSGYATNTAKWSVELDDGRLVFVKHALDDKAREWLRNELKVYGASATL